MRPRSDRPAVSLAREAKVLLRPLTYQRELRLVGACDQVPAWQVSTWPLRVTHGARTATGAAVAGVVVVGVVVEAGGIVAAVLGAAAATPRSSALANVEKSPWT